MLRVAPLPVVATYAYVNPVVAVILGWLVLGEAIDPRTVLAGGVIIFAVALIVTARGRMRQPSPTAMDDLEPAVIAAAAVPAPKPRPASSP